MQKLTPSACSKKSKRSPLSIVLLFLLIEESLTYKEENQLIHRKKERWMSWFSRDLFSHDLGMTTRKETLWLQTHLAMRCVGNHFNG